MVSAILAISEKQSLIIFSLNVLTVQNALLFLQPGSTIDTVLSDSRPMHSYSLITG